MKTQVADELQAYVMDMHTADGTLWHPEGDQIRCVACGHRCLIGEGKRGICKVRYNQDGRLRVPWGYVAGIQCDPVEKKPFFHVYPGSDALTFGMLGCDLHCAYCFPGDTPVLTDRGPMDLAEAFAASSQVKRTHDAEIAFPEGLRAVTASGSLRPVRAVFKHPYRGQLVCIRPYYLPELRCTPDHRIYSTADPNRPPELIPAGRLTEQHYLAIPRRLASFPPTVIDVAEELADHQVTYRVPWELSAADRELITTATAAGHTSRQIGARLGKSGSYIRHVRCRLRVRHDPEARTSGALVEAGRLRFPNERRPGIPATIPFDVPLARLLGYYCAEGCVVSSRGRPNSHALVFSFSRNESHLVNEVCGLLRDVLGVEPRQVQRQTTLAAAVSKASAALLLKALAGGKAGKKRVPRQFFTAPRELVRAFLDAYVAGDGHRYANGKVSVTTVSRELAYGIAALALRFGHLPSLYDTEMSEDGTVLGRKVRRQPHQYSVVWYEDASVTRKAIETPDYHLIPLRGLSRVEYEGDVYNMEVEEEHNYLAGLLAVSNCQNWQTSQALRDANAKGQFQIVSPAQLTALARRERARLVVSSYNEPLITAEWAVAVFREATAAGLTCAFVSNGNATPEVLDFLRPWIKAYKIDLKAFNDRHYRTLGTTLSNVTESIRMVHARGIWLEVVTLVIPGFNDDETELREAARFLASVSRDIPWHVTGFHQDYKMMDTAATESRELIRAAEIGAEEGLRFVYAGNRPGQVGPWEDTRCPGCQETLIERFGFLVRSYAVTPEGTCPHCNTALPGVWPADPAEVRTGDLSMYGQRLPRRVR
jgi:pyruvate formate lyase activating enzyme